ncbi:uncharacterized protein gfzf isoform X1 [Drosophila tropicalis]|uniref:uncharacterized protein gfzf isoform X1 n=2 Tax=Drosophila tropicalis TaxID=46794 RepID=UPI0035AB709C
MESNLIQSYGMDLSKVSVVRSAKGVDMLCVDNFLYHFDRIGKNNSYRWLCNRRKDKHTPCKSRICTLLPNPIDKGRHIVTDVVLAHCHERCSDHEIQKVIQRKRLSLMKMNDAYSATQPKRARIYERATAGLSGPEWISADGEPGSGRNSSFQLDFEEKDRVYMLRRRDGRVMVCIDGHLYYLSGKSYMGDMCAWTCVRNRDIECAAKICTEVTLAGAHRLHAFEESVHIHPHYSATKLMHMFEKHQIVLVEDEQTNDVLLECQNMEYFDPATLFDQQHIQHQEEGSHQGGFNQRVADDLESIIIEDCEETYEDYIGNQNEEEGLDNVDVGEVVVEQEEQGDEEEFLDIQEKWPPAYKVIEDYITPDDHNPMTETDLTKFTFLPSAKGRKVLCINKYLYHFDAQSRSNGHMFFTCIMRRDKQKTCHVRVTLDPQPNGPVVLRINGEHTHKANVSEILVRLKRLEKYSISGPSYRGSLKCKSNPNSPTHINEYQDEDSDHFENQEQEAPQVQNVVMKKIINMDGSIRVEPHDSKSHLVVEYMKDTTDNTMSDKIEMLPNSLKKKSSPHLPELTNIRRRRDNTSAPNPDGKVFPDMDLTKIWTVRSAKGGEMLCVDGYIYHAKNRGLISRNYWVCIKSRDAQVNCKSRISTSTQKDGSIRVLRVYNTHSHPISENDIKRRYFNEINKKSNKQIKFRPLHFMGKSLDEIKEEYGDLSIERLNVSNINPDILVNKKPRVSGGSASSPNSVSYICKQEPSVEDYDAHEEGECEEGPVDDQEEQEFQDELQMMDDYVNMEDATDSIIEVVEEATTDDMDNYGTVIPIFTMKLYAVSDGPPSLAVRMTLKALDIQYELINVDFCALEHRTEDYAKMNPQKEIPVLDDNGFYLSESIAIMQYLCDKYAPNSTIYPQDVNLRALINQRLCFNMGFYYNPISSHSMAPIFFDYKRTPMSLKRVENALEVFETYLDRLGTKYAAGDNVTIADFALVSATLCLEAINFDLSPYPLVQRWYFAFKEEYPQLWEIANSGMQEIKAFEQNPPDLSEMNHPFHPTRKHPKA